MRDDDENNADVVVGMSVVCDQLVFSGENLPGPYISFV